MANPKQKPNGTWTLMVCYQHLRRNLTLGKITEKQAVAFSCQIDRLTDYRRHSSGSIPMEIQVWLETLTSKHLSLIHI